MKNIMLIVGFLGVLSMTGCRQYYTGEIEVRATPKEFAPIERHNLKLELVSRRELMSGTDYEATFKLTNLDKLPVRIEEYYSDESSNLKLYYQPWLPDTAEEPDPKAWTEFIPPIESGAPREPLDLSPGVSAFIHAVLPFMEDIVVTPGYERRFFIRAELNLNSLKVSTPVYAVSVL